MEEGLTRKAELLQGGAIRIPEGFDPSDRIAHSTIGGAGIGSAVFAFDHFRVKKEVSYTEGEFELRVSDRNWMTIYRDDEVFIDDVKMLPIMNHCPDQAYCNIDRNGIINGAYCDPPFTDEIPGSPMSIDEVIERFREDNNVVRMKAIMFSSAYPTDFDATVDRMAEYVAAMREAFPKLAIGVQPYVTDISQVERLRVAGANEMKLNLECARQDIFQRLYPDRDYDQIISILRDSNTYFKKGKLATNVTYGLGETDQDIDMLMERLCRMHVLPNLRVLRVDDTNRERLLAAGIPMDPPSILRTMFLGGLQKSAMKRHGMDPAKFHCMCFNCQCCNLVPFKDF